MPNTTLPESIQPGQIGNIADREVAHQEINRMSRTTGWRDISGYLTNGWTADAARIRRDDDWVTLELTNLDGSAASSPTAAVFRFGADESSNVSSQFTPDAPAFIRLPVFESVAAGMRVHFYVTSGNGAFLASFSDGDRTGGVALHVTWRVFRPDGWPSFLPPEA